MKMTIKALEFPCEFKKKLKMKASLDNLSISFTSGHLIKIDNTKLSITELYKIIATNIESQNDLLLDMNDKLNRVIYRENF